MPSAVVQEKEERTSSSLSKDKTIVPLEEVEESEEGEKEASMSSSSRPATQNSRCSCYACISFLVKISTLADAVPSSWLLHDVLTHGKMAAACFGAIYVGFLVLIWVPMWLLSKIISEIGVYALIVR